MVHQSSLFLTHTQDELAMENPAHYAHMMVGKDTCWKNGLTYFTNIELLDPECLFLFLSHGQIA
jgi:hypothetical protein